MLPKTCNGSEYVCRSCLQWQDVVDPWLARALVTKDPKSNRSRISPSISSDMNAADENFSETETASQSSNASSIHPPRNDAHPPPRCQLRPQRPTLPFVPYADLAPTHSYDYNPPICIRYVMEWKMAFNNRKIRMHTEDNLVVAPSAFWSEQLCAKIRDIAKTTSKPSRPDSSAIVVSVNEKSEPAITKSFAELEIDWSAVERQLQAWSIFSTSGRS